MSLEKPNADDFFEMSNLNQPSTGLKRRIWVRCDAHGKYDRPCAYAQGSDKKLYLVSIAEPVEFLKGRPPGWSASECRNLRQFISVNREVLLKYWRVECCTKEMITAIKAV